jgi:hypothetical protein
MCPKTSVHEPLSLPEAAAKVTTACAEPSTKQVTSFVVPGTQERGRYDGSCLDHNLEIRLAYALGALALAPAVLHVTVKDADAYALRYMQCFDPMPQQRRTTPIRAL